MTKAASGLLPGGQALWDGIIADHDLNDAQLVQLIEACRAKDRLDKLDALLRGDMSTWVRLAHNARLDVYEIRVDAALSQANNTAATMKQLLAAMRLPDDVTGKRPQVRSARGGYAPSGAKVSSIRQRLSS